MLILAEEKAWIYYHSLIQKIYVIICMRSIISVILCRQPGSFIRALVRPMKKNMKLGVMSHYTITEKHGFTGLNFIVSGILPYADWTNKLAVGYGSKYQNPVFITSSAVSLSFSY